MATTTRKSAKRPIKRIKRPTPSAKPPPRDARNLLVKNSAVPNPASVEEAINDDNLASSDELAHAVESGVRLGNKVLEEQIRQGKRFAKAMQVGTDRAIESASPEMSGTLDRIIGFWRELATMSLDSTEKLLRSPAFRSAVMASLSMPLDVRAKAEKGAEPKVKKVVKGKTPDGTQMDITIMMDDRADPKRAVAHPLVGSRAIHPPIVGVVVGDLLRARPKLPSLPPNQPAGRYSGAIFDGTTDHEIGVMLIQISEPKK